MLRLRREAPAQFDGLLPDRPVVQQEPPVRSIASNSLRVLVGLLAATVMLLVLYSNHNEERHHVDDSHRPEVPPRTRLQEETHAANSDGTFMGFPVTYHQETPAEQPFYSTVHCVGENYGVDDAWMYKSCQFRHVCINLSDNTNNEVVMFPSPTEQRLQALLRQRNDKAVVTVQSVASSSLLTDTTTTKRVALGPLGWNATLFSNADRRRQLQWFPSIKEADDPLLLTGSSHFYQLPENVVLVPFYSSTDATSVFWQDLFSVFTLLSMFGLQQQQHRIALLDFNPNGCQTDTACNKTLGALLGAMGMQSNHYALLASAELELPTGTTSRGAASPLVCAKSAAAGMGMLARQLKPDQVDDLAWTHGAGQGATVREFRDFLAQHLQLSIPPLSSNNNGHGSGSSSRPVQIVSFLESLESINFETSVERVRVAFAGKEVSVERYETTALDFAAQARVAAKSTVFVTSCGDHTIVASFLPRGAVLIVYCEGGDGETGGTASWSKRLDWTMLNDAGYFRANWLPIRDIATDKGCDQLVHLLQSELARTRQQV